MKLPLPDDEGSRVISEMFRKASEKSQLLSAFSTYHARLPKEVPIKEKLSTKNIMKTVKYE